jgi:uncharacterized protein YndB with AHSA1/START domain
VYAGQRVGHISLEEEMFMKVLKWIGYVVGALIVLPMITLLILGQRADAGKIHASAEIAGSPEQVWGWIDDSDRLKQWVSWLVEVREPQPPRHGVGSPRTWVMKDENNGGMLMTLEGKIKEYAPPSRLTITLASQEYQFDGDESYQLTDLGNGHTRVDVDSKYHYAQWFANLMEPLVTPAAKKKLLGDLARLKALVESKAEVR